jgi:tetratricopeptide (TPR) repeat protein
MASYRKKTAINTPETKLSAISKRIRNFLLNPTVQIAFIIILGCLVYSNTLTSPFVFDDVVYVIENPAVKDLSGYLSASQNDTLPDHPGTFKKQYKNRILGHLTFALNYWIDGLNVKGYHLVNLLIHLLNSLLVYLLAYLTFRTPYLKQRTALDPAFNIQTGNLTAFLCTLLFVVHPMQTEAVTYISQRLTSLATLFFLLSLVLYIKARLSVTPRRRYSYYCISLISVILAMKTKEISFTLPIVITLYEFFFFEDNLKKRVFYLMPFLLTMTIIPLTLLYSDSSGSLLKAISEASKETPQVSRSDYLYTQFSVIVTYLQLLLLPLSQNLDYDYPVYPSFFIPQVYLPFLLLLSIFILGGYLFYRSRKKNSSSWYFRLIAFGIFYFFITLAVESSIIPISDLIVEHRVYLPSFGFFLCAATTIIMLKSKLGEDLFVKTVLPAFLLLAIIFAVASYSRNAVWSNAILLWEDVVKKSPLKARPYFNLGKVYLDQKNFDAAIAALSTGIKINPAHAGAHYNLGISYQKSGRLNEAVSEYLIAGQLRPEHANTHNNLGLCYDRMGRLDEAALEFALAIKLNPFLVEPYNNLGITLYKQGRFHDAYNSFLQAVTLNPKNIDAHRNLAAYHAKRGEFADALKEYLTVAELDAGNADTYNVLGILYWKLNRFDDAVKAYMSAIRLKPDIAETHNRLGFIYEQQGRIDDAISEYNNAVKLNPSFAEAHYSLGLCLLQKGNTPGAIAELERAFSLNSGLVDARKMLAKLRAK